MDPLFPGSLAYIVQPKGQDYNLEGSKVAQNSVTLEDVDLLFLGSLA